MTSGLEFCQPSGRLIFRQRRLGSSASLKKKERKTCGLRSAALQSRANVLASFLKVTQLRGTQFSNCIFFGLFCIYFFLQKKFAISNLFSRLLDFFLHFLPFFLQQAFFLVVGCIFFFAFFRPFLALSRCILCLGKKGLLQNQNRRSQNAKVINI